MEMSYEANTGIPLSKSPFDRTLTDEAKKHAYKEGLARLNVTRTQKGFDLLFTVLAFAKNLLGMLPQGWGRYWSRGALIADPEG